MHAGPANDGEKSRQAHSWSFCKPDTMLVSKTFVKPSSNKPLHTASIASPRMDNSFSTVAEEVTNNTEDVRTTPAAQAPRQQRTNFAGPPPQYSIAAASRPIPWTKAEHEFYRKLNTNSLDISIVAAIFPKPVQTQ